MSANFEWQTEDDNRDQSSWDIPPESPSPSPTGWKARWRLIAVLLLLAAATASLVWWRVDQQIDANLQAIRNDVASSYNLLQSAAANQDEELFRSVLSGRDPGWTTAALALFSEGLLTDRRQLGLMSDDGSLPLTLPVPVEEAAADERVAEFSFSPDLTEATVLTWHPYIYEDASGSAETVLLQQTSIFRMGGQRWLYSPPTSEFWGAWETAETNRLDLTYPERDRELALRLADDIDGLLDRVCTELSGIDCEPDYRFALRLDRDPGALVALIDSAAVLATRDDAAAELRLPAPTLVGRPVGPDETILEPGYQALYQAYAKPVVQAALVDLTGWRCCDQQYLFEVLAEWQLAELGLRAWPVSQADWDRILGERIELSDIDEMWRPDRSAQIADEERWQLYAATEFLLDAFAPRSAADMQRLLPVSPNMEVWLTELATDPAAPREPNWVLSSLDEAWWIYALQGDVGDKPEGPLTAGEQLLVSCTVVEDNQLPNPSIAYRLDPDTWSWSELFEVEGFVWLSPLADSTAILSQEYVLADEQWQTFVWRDGERSPLHTTSRGFNFSFAESDPSGRYVISYEFDDELGQTRALLLDLEACDEDGCAAAELPGRPAWSPDGRQAIISGRSNSFPDDVLITNERVSIFDASERLSEQILYLGSGPTLDPDEERLEIGRGYSPFWVDETTFGFIDVILSDEPGRALEQQLMIGTVENPELQSLLTSLDLKALFPLDDMPSNLIIAYAVAHPIDTNLLYVVAVDNRARMAYAFAYDRAADEATLQMVSDYDLNHSFSFSPDGRYALMTGREPDAARANRDNGMLYLHNLATNKTTPFEMQPPFFLSSVSYDWTSDGRWLAISMDEGLLALVSLDDGRTRTLPHELGNCTSVVWLQPGRPEG